MTQAPARILATSALLIIVTLACAGGPAGQPAPPESTAPQLAEPRETRANEIQPPERIMDILGVRPGLVVGEVGAGRGRVTVHLANRVGEKGRIYANDIDEAALDYLKARCRRLGLTNVETILSRTDDACFPPDKLDLVLMTWVYHHVDAPVPLLRSLRSSLRPRGIVAMVEPKPSETEKEARVLNRESVGREAREAGFILDAVIEDKFPRDNLFILRPAIPGAPESHDPAKARVLWPNFLKWSMTSGEACESGRDRWDLVAMIRSRAPVEKPDILTCLKASTRPGGH
jgi:SAM-dependent methyltransferase